MIESLPLLAWPSFRQALTILIFHRVLAVPDPLRPGEPDAAGFDRFMNFIARHFAVLPLHEAAVRLRQGRLPRRACCITFDDGYADNLTVALPILEKYRLPATVFIATGYLDGGRMFNDAVIDAIAMTSYTRLDLTEVGLGEHSIASLEERRAAVAAILEQLKYRPPGQRRHDVARLHELADCAPLPCDIMLTSEQVRELSRRGVDIGGHTINHPILASVEDDVARQEIAGGKQRLEAITGKPVSTFAYPNGRPHRDYAVRHVDMVRELGFELAVSTAHGVGNPGSDSLQLPRFTPWGATNVKRSAQMMRNAWKGKAAATC
ncbi:MAG: polysaccharide deacetylase family protein [Pseudomonadota bacterium]